jgi:uncharacterized SAM-binding protein YcdF (DUF218 family)
MKPRRTIRKILLAAVLLLVLLGLVAVLFPRPVLTVESGPVSADAMVVLGGGPPVRPQRAVELFRAGEAPRIIISGIGDDLANQRVLLTNQIPESAILLENKSRTTYENARFSIPLLRQMGAKRVIIVTSWYHSRRALATFRQLAPDLKFYSRPEYLGYDSKESRVIREHMQKEYPKLLGYWIRYGVWPF